MRQDEMRQRCNETKVECPGMPLHHKTVCSRIKRISKHNKQRDKRKNCPCPQVEERKSCSLHESMTTNIHWRWMWKWGQKSSDCTGVFHLEHLSDIEQKSDSCRLEIFGSIRALGTASRPYFWIVDGFAFLLHLWKKFTVGCEEFLPLFRWRRGTEDEFLLTGGLWLTLHRPFPHNYQSLL